MRVGTLVMLGAAFVCALFAALLANYWLSSQKQTPHTQVIVQQTTKKSGSDTGNIVVASSPLPFGAELTYRNTKLVPWPKSAIPKGAFTNKGDLLKPGKRMVVSAFEINEPILRQKITAPDDKASLSTIIEDNKRAVTVRVNDVAGVAGFVQPGDRVDVMLTRSVATGKEKEKSRTPSTFTDVLLQNVRVLAIDQAASRKSKVSPAKAVTLEVNTIQAQKILLGSSVGQLTLALRRNGWAENEVTRRISINDIIKGDVDDTQSTTQPVIGVTRSLQRKEYKVPYDEDGGLFSNFLDDEIRSN